MEKTTGHILKGSDVKLQGQVRLDAAQVIPIAANGKSVTSTAPQVRIVENQPEFAVIEVTCNCGKKTYAKCEYANGQPADQKTKQK